MTEAGLYSFLMMRYPLYPPVSDKRMDRWRQLVHHVATMMRTVCRWLQGELEEKDSELSTVKSDREKLEKEMQSMLQKEKDDGKGKGKGPGGMLHSALQQLQRELRREAVANEKLMVKAESLLKDGSKPLNGKSSTALPGASSTSGQVTSTDSDDTSSQDDEEQSADDQAENEGLDEPGR